MKHNTNFLHLSLAMVATFVVALSPAKAVNVFFFSGASEGAVGHGAMAGPPAPFDHNNLPTQLGAHPLGAGIDSVYTLLGGRDIFDTVTGAEGALSPINGPPFTASSAGGELASMGIAGDLYFSFSGLVMNQTVASDYNFDGPGLLEYRTYRGGTYEFYNDDGGGAQLFARTTNVVLDMVIDYNLGTIATSLTGTADTGPGLLAKITTGTGTNDTVLIDSGSTSEGAPFTGDYGIFDTTATFSFSAIPEPSIPLLSLVGIAAIALRRRRRESRVFPSK